MGCAIRLLPANEDLGALLEGALHEHGIRFEREGNLTVLAGPCVPERAVELLRHVLSEAERRDLYVLESDAGRYSRPMTLEDWWRTVETAWFSRALDENRFGVWFQPTYDTRAAQVIAHECFIRVQTGRIYHHAEIFDTAVARGELHDFDALARGLAIDAAARQHGRGAFFVGLRAASIYRPKFCLLETLKRAREAASAGTKIIFGISEVDLIWNPAHVKRIADCVRAEGYEVALSQVGAGSGAGIQELRPNYVKIDKNLTRNVDRSVCASGIRKLVEHSEGIGASVIADGVERVQTMEDLWLLGVERMQGYLFGRPAREIVRPENDLLSLTRALEVSEAAERVLCN